jgi:hypothetical protein
MTAITSSQRIREVTCLSNRNGTRQTLELLKGYQVQGPHLTLAL